MNFSAIRKYTENFRRAHSINILFYQGETVKQKTVNLIFMSSLFDIYFCKYTDYIHINIFILSIRYIYAQMLDKIIGTVHILHQYFNDLLY